MQEKSKQTESEGKSFFWTTLPFFIIAHAAHHFLTALPQPLLPAIRDEFKLSYTKASFIPTAFAISGATGQLPAGWLADRVGPKLLIAVGIIGVALAGILVGFSQSFVMLISFLLLMGLASGGVPSGGDTVDFGIGQTAAPGSGSRTAPDRRKQFVFYSPHNCRCRLGDLGMAGSFLHPGDSHNTFRPDLLHISRP